MTDQTAADAPYVLRDRSGPVLWLTLNRPAQRNPLSSGMIAAIKSAISAANDMPEVRVIVLAGSGPVFSAGHDLKQMSGMPEDGNLTREEHLRQILDGCAEMMLGIMHSPKAIIACVQGTATAAGCQLVSACDLAIASEDAKFCTPGVNIGSFCTTPLVSPAVTSIASTPWNLRSLATCSRQKTPSFWAHQSRCAWRRPQRRNGRTRSEDRLQVRARYSHWQGSFLPADGHAGRRRLQIRHRNHDSGHHGAGS